MECGVVPSAPAFQACAWYSTHPASGSAGPAQDPSLPAGFAVATAAVLHMPMCLPYDLAHLRLLCPTRHISTAIATLCTAPNSCTTPGGRYSPAQAGRVGLWLAAEG